ncbi:MAG: insulinase family protein [Clostridia bacterium]|nr:insulinase family protein [Clostridia bacterium]
MKYNKQDLKQGITMHLIDTDKFKTNLVAIFLSTALSRENVTKNAVLSSVLRRGTQNLRTQEEISKKLEEMYGADYNCGLDKIGDNHVLKLYLESVNDKFLPQNDENMLKESIKIISEIAFNPLVENGEFKKEYIEHEKENVKQIIEAKKDNKAKYAAFRCVEEMYKDEPAGLYKFGYVEDLEEIDSKSLYEYYQSLINECKIDIFVSGNLENIDVKELIENNENIKKLNERQAKYCISNIEKREEVKEERLVEEALDVTQGKLVMGYDLVFDDQDMKNENLKYEAMLYNALLGGSANSKLFQNVREKASLAYTAASSYSRYKSNIFINCGIEIDNFEKAVTIIKEQIEDMKNGDFSDQDIEDVKKGIISSIVSMDDEQDTLVIYFLGQELGNTNVNLQEYIDKIQSVNKSQIQNIASKVRLNTIYFLKGKE